MGEKNSKGISRRKAFFLGGIEREKMKMRCMYMFEKHKEHQCDWPDCCWEVDRMWSSSRARHAILSLLLALIRTFLLYLKCIKKLLENCSLKHLVTYLYIKLTITWRQEKTKEVQSRVYCIGVGDDNSLLWMWKGAMKYSMYRR